MADTVTSEELQQQLEQLAEDIGVGVGQLVGALQGNIDNNTGKIDVNSEAIKAMMSRLDAIDVIDGEDDVDSIAEKIKTLNEMLSNDGTLATDLLQRIADNKAAVNALAADLQTENKRATDAEAAILEKVDANKAIADANASTLSSLKDTVTANKAAIDGKIADAVKDVNDLKSANEALFTHEDADGNTIEGSVDAKLREAGTENLAKSKSYTDAEAAKLQEQIDAIGEIDGDKVNELVEKVDKVTAELEDTTDDDDNVVKGIKTRVSDMEAQAGNNAAAAAAAKAEAAAALAVANAAGLAKGIICGRKAANKFMAAVNLPSLDEDICPTGDDDL